LVVGLAGGGRCLIDFCTQVINVIL
jgi:hypothetical protein